MRTFILAEAVDKAADITKKGEEEFSIEVHKLITDQKEKIRQAPCHVFVDLALETS
ncbi:unnamed protein product [Polarella glacialis]|uniref:Uncharacterized protein n=1 Tax=Polarella glacialis TaxID=89957 RepID=A0A813GXW8_POLGL|nr:unnamed protein product [Polarella glacialis]